MSDPAAADGEWRISDGDRDAAVQALGEHYATGRLDRAEYDERVDRAWAARTNLELLDRRVDRSGARLPRTVGALGDLLDHLVAVEVLLHVGVEHVEDGGADVAPPGARAGPLPGSTAPTEVAATSWPHALPEHLGHPWGRPARPAAEPTSGSPVTGTVPVAIAVSHVGIPFLSSRMWSEVPAQVSESLPMQ